MWHLAKKLLLVFALLLLTQVIFFIANTRIFHLDGLGEAMTILWGNIRFGLASTALFLAPYLVMMLLPIQARHKKSYRTIAEILFWVGALILLITNLVDVAYYQFTYRRMSAMMFRYMTVGGDMGSLIPKFLVDYWYATLSAIVVVTLLIIGCLQLRLRNADGWGKPQQQQYRSERKVRNQEIWCSVLGFAVLVILLRGGVERRWIQPGEVVRYAQPKNGAMVMNSAYNIVRTIGHLDVTPVNFTSMTEANTIYPTEYTPQPNTLTANTSIAEAGKILNNNPEALLKLLMLSYSQFGDSTLATAINNLTNEVRKPKNVVVVLLESFSQEYMGSYNHGIMESFTPFLDGLAQQSICYQGRSNGKESIESIPAIFASVPSWSLAPFILSGSRNDTLNGLPAILKKHGYQSAMFHGSYNGTMNFDKFCFKIGFDRYYGKNEYLHDTGDSASIDGAWGIFDEPFLQYSAQEMNKMKEPFLTCIYNISSHHPYGLPDGYEKKFRDGKHPILRTIAYSDYAIQRFFEEAKTQPWYKNTLFVIVADHPGPSLAREYNDYSGWYKIPVMFFDPNNTDKALMSNDIVQQIDIMPTLLDMLNINEPAICFGHSILQRTADDHGYQIVFGNDYYQMERNGRITIYSPYKTIGNEEDLEFLKAAIQVYNSKLLNNQMTMATK